MNILATHIFIQFDERWLPGSSPAQAPCAEELQMPEDLVDNGNLLKSHPYAMKTGSGNDTYIILSAGSL
jgi:hypothetical protein